MNLSIEQTTDANLLAQLNQHVQNLHHQWYPHLFKPFHEANISAFFSEILLKSEVTAFVAKTENEAIGFVMVFQKTYPENPFKYTYTSLYIDQIGVTSHYQSKGVGKALIKHVEAFAQEKGITRLETDHWSKNQKAAAFFKAHGFGYSKLMASKSLENTKT